MTALPDRGSTIRHAIEQDQPRIAAVVDDWFGGRRVRHLAMRAWFRHFASTSWVAADARDRPIGFLIGFRSPDRQDEAVIHLLGVDPNHRRAGIGRGLVARFVDEVVRDGVTAITVVAWPDDPIATTFFRAIGFRPDDGPGSRNLYGGPAFADYEATGEDRVVFVRRIPAER